MQGKFPDFTSAPIRFLRRLLGPNGDLMAVAAVVSAVVVALVHQHIDSLQFDRAFGVPVAVRSENQGFTVFSHEPASIEVKLRGSQDDFAALDPARLSVELVSRNKKEGLAQETLAIRPANILGVGALRVVAISTNAVTVKYDPIVSWRATGRVAAPRLDGAPVQGSASVEMPTNVVVEIQGSESKLAVFREKKILLPTSPVNVEGKTESFDAVVSIIPPPDSGITKVEPSTVLVHVDVQTIAAAGVEEDNTPFERVSSPQQAQDRAPAASGGESDPAAAEPEGEGGGDGAFGSGPEERLDAPQPLDAGAAPAE